MKEFAALIFIVVWMAGIILAKGFFSVLLACVMPLWSMYLVTEKSMIYFGLV